MHPDSRRIIGQILAPTGDGPEAPPAAASPPMTIAQIVHPQAPYAGPERRAGGVLVAEVVDAPAPTPPSAER